MIKHEMDELEENEFNLNIPRYVDTFEPEEEIDLDDAIKTFEEAVSAQSKVEGILLKLKKVIEV